MQFIFLLKRKINNCVSYSKFSGNSTNWQTLSKFCCPRKSYPVRSCLSGTRIRNPCSWEAVTKHFDFQGVDIFYRVYQTVEFLLNLKTWTLHNNIQISKFERCHFVIAHAQNSKRYYVVLVGKSDERENYYWMEQNRYQKISFVLHNFWNKVRLVVSIGCC